MNNISVGNFNELFNNYDGSKENEFVSCDDFLINLRELKENKLCVYKTRISSYLLIKNLDGMDILETALHIDNVGVNYDTLDLILAIAKGNWEYQSGKIKLYYTPMKQELFKLGKLVNIEILEVESKREFCREFNIYLTYKTNGELINKKYIAQKPFCGEVSIENE
jgi:hypothetical protein